MSFSMYTCSAAGPRRLRLCAAPRLHAQRGLHPCREAHARDDPGAADDLGGVAEHAEKPGQSVRPGCRHSLAARGDAAHPVLMALSLRGGCGECHLCTCVLAISHLPSAPPLTSSSVNCRMATFGSSRRGRIMLPTWRPTCCGPH